ncbi:hypothetical protein N0V85_008242 [Neurospora sp. IMI 360204]|nr:hypothetical protein N0V85_008242 [Neurospora sp. IMI 360204]
MPPARMDIDVAHAILDSVWWEKVKGLARSYADHADQEAWLEHFQQCLQKMEQGPAPKAALTSNPGALAGTKRRRVDYDDGDDDHNDDDDGEAISSSTNINVGRASHDLPPSFSLPAPQTSISGPINPIPHHDGHEANPEKPLLALQSSEFPTCRNEDLAGRILWAPRKALDNMRPQDTPRMTCPHPALILSPKVEEDGTVDFLVLTSFGMKTLTERFPKHSEKETRSFFFPVEGTEPHPDDPVNNFVVKTTKTPHNQRIPSYVNTTAVRNTPFDCLLAYKDGGQYSQDYFIDETSYHKLVDFVKNKAGIRRHHAGPRSWM